MANTDVDEELDEPRPAELKDVTVHEISLVDRPANKRPFLLFKSKESQTRKVGEYKLTEQLTKEATEELQKALNTEGEDEAEKLEKIDGKSKNAAKAALRILQHLTSGMDPEEVQKFLADAGFGYEKADETPEATEAEKAIAKRDAALAALPENVRAILKEEREADAAEKDTLRKQVEEGAKWRADFIAKAEAEAIEKLVDELQIPGMSREDQVIFVAALPEAQRESMKGWATALRVTKGFSDPTTVIGTPRRGEHVTSANADTMEKARALVKADTSGELDLADAIVQVRAEDPALAERARLETLGIGG